MRVEAGAALGRGPVGRPPHDMGPFSARMCCAGPRRVGMPQGGPSTAGWICLQVHPRRNPWVKVAPNVTGVTVPHAAKPLADSGGGPTIVSPESRTAAAEESPTRPVPAATIGRPRSRPTAQSPSPRLAHLSVEVDAPHVAREQLQPRVRREGDVIEFQRKIPIDTGAQIGSSSSHVWWPFVGGRNGWVTPPFDQRRRSRKHTVLPRLQRCRHSGSNCSIALHCSCAPAAPRGTADR